MMFEKLTAIENDWYGRLDDICEELEEMGFEVLDCNREYITVGYEEDGRDAEALIRLGGTERTITIEGIRETAWC